MPAIEEADMTINGKPITFGESMTIRVACSSFLMQLDDDAFRASLGRIAIGYETNLRSIMKKIMEKQK